MDIVQHFPSLDHAVLKRELFRVIEDGRVRALIDIILASGEGVLADEYNMTLLRQGAISFGELDASVQGWVNHVRYGDTWGLRAHLFGHHPL